MTGQLWAEVRDSHGLAVLVIDRDGTLGKLTPRQRSKLENLASGLVGELAKIIGCTETDAAQNAIADLIRLISDEEAYERVAERRGLLPL